MKTLVWMCLCFVFSGCAMHSVKYEEIDKNGASTTLKVTELVGPGGKAISEGKASASIGADGAWKVHTGQTTDTDATASVELMRALVELLKEIK